MRPPSARLESRSASGSLSDADCVIQETGRLLHEGYLLSVFASNKHPLQYSTAVACPRFLLLD